MPGGKADKTAVNKVKEQERGDSMKKILVIGSSNMDFVMKLDHMPAKGETVLGNSLKKIPGGKGANQAYACGVLGAEISFLGVVGDDDIGEILIKNLKHAGVEVQYVERTKEPTGMAVIYVNGQGENEIVVVPGANNQCNEQYIENHMDLIRDADILLIQMEIPAEGVYLAIRKAKKLGKMVILNPAPAPESIPEDVYPYIDILTPNETELERLTGSPAQSEEEIKIAAGQLLKLGVSQVVVTMGERGAMLVNAAEAYVLAPPKVEAVDSTAAGDTFNAALAVRLAEGGSMKEAISFANQAAALSVAKEGAQASIPSKEEVLERRK